MAHENGGERRHVVVVGGGFAGVGCVKRLAREDGVAVTLIDRQDRQGREAQLAHWCTLRDARSEPSALRAEEGTVLMIRSLRSLIA